MRKTSCPPHLSTQLLVLPSLRWIKEEGGITSGDGHKDLVQAEKRERKKPPTESGRRFNQALEGSYGDVVRIVHQKAYPDERSAIIKGLRKTRAAVFLSKFGEATEVKSAWCHH
ncbi:hypothetical protein J6590_043159 [Homalodisca vitripennis]|nr:hypothetical protein J6590_043159 [Homalodisca vitripennis]